MTCSTLDRPRTYEDSSVTDPWISRRRRGREGPMNDPRPRTSESQAAEFVDSPENEPGDQSPPSDVSSGDERDDAPIEGEQP